MSSITGSLIEAFKISQLQRALQVFLCLYQPDASLNFESTVRFMSGKVSHLDISAGKFRFLVEKGFRFKQFTDLSAKYSAFRTDFRFASASLYHGRQDLLYLPQIYGQMVTRGLDEQTLSSTQKSFLHSMCDKIDIFEAPDDENFFRLDLGEGARFSANSDTLKDAFIQYQKYYRVRLLFGTNQKCAVHRSGWNHGLHSDIAAWKFQVVEFPGGCLTS